MSPAAILRPKPGQRVLDICAAPGGKSVQLAGYMQGSGVLASNDISPSRCRALVKNLEMAGVTNAIVLTESPHRLADRFPAFFDCILVDAPCSGEGMFRRDPDAVKAYTANKPESCGALQQEILRHAARMLKPGGRLVYSTCTFNPLENENAVYEFLASHPGFELLPIDHDGLGLTPGQGKWVNDQCKQDGLGKNVNKESLASALNRTARIWPHTAPGEGHFIALMAKAEGGAISSTSNTGESNAASAAKKANENEVASTKKTNNTKRANNKRFNQPGPHGQNQLPEEFLTFCYENLRPSVFASLNHLAYQHNNSLFLKPENLDLSGLRVARSGWLLGECAKGRFIPSQALAMGITKEQARYAIDLPEPIALRYLKGESLDMQADSLAQSNQPSLENLTSAPGKPWVLICHKGYPLGWARLVHGRLKNQLPTGWVVS